MKQEVKPAEGKLGIMVVGCGAVATTFMTGVQMVRKWMFIQNQCFISLCLVNGR